MVSEGRQICFCRKTDFYPVEDRFGLPRYSNLGSPRRSSRRGNTSRWSAVLYMRRNSRLPALPAGENSAGRARSKNRVPTSTLQVPRTKPRQSRLESTSLIPRKNPRRSRQASTPLIPRTKPRQSRLEVTSLIPRTKPRRSHLAPSSSSSMLSLAPSHCISSGSSASPADGVPREFDDDPLLESLTADRLGVATSRIER